MISNKKVIKNKVVELIDNYIFGFYHFFIEVCLSKNYKSSIIYQDQCYRSIVTKPARLSLFWLVRITSWLGSARYLNEPKNRLGSLGARVGSLSSRARYKKYSKYNICVYLKINNINNTKIIYLIALSLTKYSYELTYQSFVKCKVLSNTKLI
jgi:hypothetical protein